MVVLQNLIRIGFVAFLVLSVLGAILALGTYLYLAPSLPSVATLKDVHLQTPLRVYTRGGDLLAEYGEKRRKPLGLDDIPKRMRQAFIAAEDDRFFHHPGVDYQGLIRAAIHLLRTGEKGPGGSTITMQLTRNFFLSSERTYTRKLKEIFLALKVERELSKNEILELYLNKIYLGHRAYGVGAAAEVYYGSDPGSLNLSQISMIAGLPKAPSAFNPIANPERALQRRDYVLGRMFTLKMIPEEAYQTALAAPVSAELHRASVAIEAPYVGEIVRARMVTDYGPAAYTQGFKVYTTIEADLQRAADGALRRGLLAYDRRHGYRGPEKTLPNPDLQDETTWATQWAGLGVVSGLQPALVTSVSEKDAQVYLRNGTRITLPWEGMAWARKYLDINALGPKPTSAQEILKAGDIIRVLQDAKGQWRLSQLPQVQGALVSLDPHDGSILALAGGFDFNQSKFNRATQAQRQPGSSFKPFVYSAALEKGFTPASVINDAPVVFSDDTLEDSWRPENYSGKFYGPTRLRVALTKSRNLVSIRLLSSIGRNYALDHAVKFGFRRERLPADLSLALGSGTVTPLELAAGYAVFANGGYRIHPYLVERIEGAGGEVIFEADPPVACEAPCDKLDASQSAKSQSGAQPSADDTTDGVDHKPRRLARRAIPAGNAYQTVSMMKDVIRRGTGRKARSLNRSDLAGKTGTTNDQRDAWFSGYNADIVATVWVGFDKHTPLGNRETGGAAALPVWIDFMQVALKDKPQRNLPQPEGMVTVRIDPETGLVAEANDAAAIFETFRADHVPKRQAYKERHVPASSPARAVEIPEQLF